MQDYQTQLAFRKKIGGIYLKQRLDVQKLI